MNWGYTMYLHVSIDLLQSHAIKENNVLLSISYGCGKPYRRTRQDERELVDKVHMDDLLAAYHGLLYPEFGDISINHVTLSAPYIRVILNYCLFTAMLCIFAVLILN